MSNLVDEKRLEELKEEFELHKLCADDCSFLITEDILETLRLALKVVRAGKRLRPFCTYEECGGNCERCEFNEALKPFAQAESDKPEAESTECDCNMYPPMPGHTHGGPMMESIDKGESR